MAEWDRNTPWRQGHVLAAETAKIFGLAHATSPHSTAVVVISHDCDLAQLPEVDPYVEVIVGRIVEQADGNFTHAKAVRTLHLLCSLEGAKKWIEVVATEKISVEKTRLAGHRHNSNLELLSEARSILQNWLAARYRRAAFPDEFNKRLKETGVEDGIKKIIKDLGDYITAIFFDVDGAEEVDRTSPEDTYTLNIVLLFSTETDPTLARRAAEKAAAEIETLFNRKCCVDSKNWKNIELQSCVAMSDEAISYRQSLSFKAWRVDYISLRSNPQQPVLEA
jgi:hypothetical protein